MNTSSKSQAALTKFNEALEKLSEQGATDSEPREHIKQSIIGGLFMGEEPSDYYECYSESADRKVQKLVTKLIESLVTQSEGLGLVAKIAWLNAETADDLNLAPLSSWGEGLLFKLAQGDDKVYNQLLKKSPKALKSISFDALPFSQEELNSLIDELN